MSYPYVPIIQVSSLSCDWCVRLVEYGIVEPASPGARFGEVGDLAALLFTGFMIDAGYLVKGVCWFPDGRLVGVDWSLCDAAKVNAPPVFAGKLLDQFLKQPSIIEAIRLAATEFV